MINVGPVHQFDLLFESYFALFGLLKYQNYLLIHSYFLLVQMLK